MSQVTVKSMSAQTECKFCILKSYLKNGYGSSARMFAQSAALITRNKAIESFILTRWTQLENWIVKLFCMSLPNQHRMITCFLENLSQYWNVIVETFLTNYYLIKLSRVGEITRFSKNYFFFCLKVSFLRSLESAHAWRVSRGYPCPGFSTVCERYLFFRRYLWMYYYISQPWMSQKQKLGLSTSVAPPSNTNVIARSSPRGTTEPRKSSWNWTNIFVDKISSIMTQVINKIRFLSSV